MSKTGQRSPDMTTEILRVGAYYATATPDLDRDYVHIYRDDYVWVFNGTPRRIAVVSVDPEGISTWLESKRITDPDILTILEQAAATLKAKD